MANSKISELSELTTVANDDVFAIVDDSASETKKISFANLSAGISVGNATQLQFTALNSTGSTLTKGSAVYVSGHTSETQVANADNSSASSMPAFGIVSDDIANGATGTIIIGGEVSGINTSSFSVGDELYVGTAGALTATKPTGTALIQKIAKVTKAAASGELLVTGAGRSNDLPNLPDGSIWIGDSSGVPQDKTLTAGTNVTITEDGTSVTIAATGGGGGIAAVVDDTTPQLGGNLDVNGQDIVSVTNGDIEIAPDGTGTVTIKGNATGGSGKIVLNCEQNSHGVTIQGPAHSAAATYTLTLPEDDGALNQPLVSDGSGVLSFSDTVKVTLQGPVTGSELEFQAQLSAVSSAGQVEGTVVVFGTTTGMTAGDVYVWNGTNWVAVDGDADTTTKGLMGVALGTAATDGLLTHGVAYLSHDPGAAGDILYVDTVTAGNLTATQPSAAGDFVRVAGYCLADNKVFFSPSQDYIEIGA